MSSEEEVKVSEKQLNDCRTQFKAYDKKSSGRVMQKDLGKVFKALGLTVTDEKIKAWSDEMDEEATGSIDFDSFIILFKRKLKEDIDEKELREAFRVLDKDNKGTIHTDVLRWILKSLGDDLTDDDIENMVNDVDTDGSGTVDYEEFKQLMMSDV